MFHHFHDDKHLPGQGSLSENDFRNMLSWLQKNYSLIGANNYINKFKSGTLSNSEICLSFDDALKCQYHIAIPVLEELKLDAFFFVYSSAFTDTPDFLEIYRLFRTSQFENIDDFYSNFFKIIKQSDNDKYNRQKSLYKKSNYLSAFPFYSENDKWFRYIRDHYLGPSRYHEIMKRMMLSYPFKIDDAMKNLWMTEDELKSIHKKGHTIGLHSYTHPTQMSKLTRKNQESEYSKNYEHLSQLLESPIKAMSHPCGNYNNDTLEILEKMGIEIGFRSSMSITDINSSLEIPREDHANVLNAMNS
tara:strand:+ start:1189 stop:2097 length:909 start_codon:yes stop_codon:yes gene_type:complete